MPNLLDIRRRIRSVKNTQQITQAMKMVSAAKLRRAQEAAMQARPYAQRIEAMVNGLAGFINPQDLDPSLAALLARREVKRRLVITVSTDSGLVGAFNANVLKQALSLSPAAAATEYIAVGRKSRDFLRRRDLRLIGEHLGVFTRTVDYDIARQIAQAAMAAYADARVDEVVLVGNEFKSVLQQRIVARQLLPFELPEQTGPGRDYIFETPPAALLAKLLPRALEAQVYRALLESLASEHAARMNAMEAATSNAGDLIDSLTLNMNRVRQAAITKEIIEVVSGAAALG
ncbi:MAG TPA: ATP synthase F1 subunit gamma [Terriglobales bacterium]|nr:ATP synthase F1 subunit gamma [Terriglobales bacterium]